MQSHKFIIVFTVLCMMILPLSALAWGDLYTVRLDCDVFLSRRLDAPKTQTLQQGQTVKIDFIEGEWAALFPLDESKQDKSKAIGYVLIKNLDFLQSAPEIESADSQETSASQAESSQDTRSTEKKSQALFNESPIKIMADRMVYNEAKQSILFQGNVKVEHQDLLLVADKLTAFLSTDGAPQAGKEQIKKIIAKGKVRLSRQAMLGKCQTLSYTVQDSILCMEGDPVLEDGQNNTLTGKTIRYYLNENRSEVLGGEQKPVQAVFTVPKDVRP